MKTSILVVSYLQDLPWLTHCLRSIEKFATGFHETVVLVPQDEAQRFRTEIPFGIGLRLATYNRTPDKAKWHLHHQAMKCRADEVF